MMVAFRRQSNIWSLIFDKRLFSPFQNDCNGLRIRKIDLFCSKNNEIQDLTKILSWCGIEQKYLNNPD